MKKKPPMKLASFALALIAVVAAAAQSSRADYVLDIVSFGGTSDHAVQGPQGILPGRGGTAVDHRGDAPSDTKVTLLSVDRANYETGDSVIYEVEIENVGTRPIVLPWSPTRVIPHTEERDPQSVEGSLFLEVRDRAGLKRLAWLDPQPLFGSESVAHSLQRLAPGEKALIRAPGHWRTSERERNLMLSQPAGMVRVSAVFHLTQSQLLVRSANGIDVSVQDRLRR